ncbi:MAG: hypothetical protein BRD35_00805 [Bacteroidetes bacterium QH_7_62_13]|nr:MAG: hypothetical protein BRD35_00805 [Bacteroidetes bacterium QH_7_62_13]
MSTDLPLSDSEEAASLSTWSARPDASEVVDTLKDAAEQVLRRRFRLVLLLRNAYERMSAQPSVLSAVWTDLQTMLRLLVRWADRSYRRVGWTPLVLMVGAVLYFVVPTDAVPDALGALGFVDDVTVISMVVRRVRTELDRFREWEANKALQE